MTRSIFPLLSLLCFLLVPLFAAASESREDDKAVVAKVNGVPVLEKQLGAEVEHQLHKYARYGMRTATPALRETLRKQALDRIIDQELLHQASSKVVVKDIEAQVQKKVAAMKKTFKTAEEFEHYLASQHLTAEEYADSFRRQIRLNAYLASLGMAAAEPTEEEIAAFYEKAKENFKREETVRPRHILLALDQNSSMQEQEKVRRKADQLLAQLRQNGDLFPGLAADNSACARSKDKGGDLGYIKRGFMPAEFDEAAFALPAGELSGIVATRYGLHIIQVTDRQPAGYASFADVHDFIKKYLQGELMSKQMSHHVEDLRNQADIQRFLP
jgi:peptidyl-prolyl cis-trans isomerase C